MIVESICYSNLFWNINRVLVQVLVIGTKYWNTLNEEEQNWMKSAAKVSAEAQKEFWNKNVAECMVKLKAANVEIYKPEKSLFAEKVKPVLAEFMKDPKMKKLVEAIQAQLQES